MPTSSLLGWTLSGYPALLLRWFLREPLAANYDYVSSRTHRQAVAVLTPYFRARL